MAAVLKGQAHTSKGAELKVCFREAAKKESGGLILIYLQSGCFALLWPYKGAQVTLTPTLRLFGTVRAG